MTNVVSIFTKTKKDEPDEKARTAVSHTRRSDANSGESEDRFQVQVVVEPSDGTAEADRETGSKFNDIELANAERLKKLEEQRKKDNDMVLKSYRIK